MFFRFSALQKQARFSSRSSLRVPGKFGEVLAQRVDHNIDETREESGLGAELFGGESDPSPKDSSQNIALADVI